jgi:hypothetical protein
MPRGSPDFDAGIPRPSRLDRKAQTPQCSVLRANGCGLLWQGPGSETLSSPLVVLAVKLARIVEKVNRGQQGPRELPEPCSTLARRIPDHGKDAIVVLANRDQDWQGACAARIPGQRARGSHRPCRCSCHSGFSPRRSRRQGHAPEVGMGLGALVAVRDDIDAGPHRACPRLASVAAIVIPGDDPIAVMVCLLYCRRW